MKHNIHLEKLHVCVPILNGGVVEMVNVPDTPSSISFMHVDLP